MTRLPYFRIGDYLMDVIKRNGSVEDFDFQKIKNAVNKAFNAEYNSDAPEEFIDYLETLTSTFGDNIKIEDIQNLVENALMEQK